jgi:hypothetical protein
MPTTEQSHHILIASEVTARLEEMEQIKAFSSLTFIAALAALGAQSPVAYRIAIQFMHGCTSRYLSYAEQAKLRGVSKQAIHKEFVSHLAKIKEIFPEAAEQILAMRNAGHAGHGNENSTKGKS